MLTVFVAIIALAAISLIGWRTFFGVVLFWFFFIGNVAASFAEWLWRTLRAWLFPVICNGTHRRHATVKQARHDLTLPYIGCAIEETCTRCGECWIYYPSER